MVKSVAMVAAALATAACNGAQSRNENPTDSIRAADEALQQAIAKRELERIASFYAEDAVLLPMAEPIVTGKEAIRAEWRHVLCIPGIQNVSALKHIDVSRSGDLGYSRGTYISHMVGPKGEPLTEPGKWVSIWKKQSDGQWRIVVDIYNTDIMPPVHAPSTAGDH
jgi:uncharacterized protein (TIGR02246 family)